MEIMNSDVFDCHGSCMGFPIQIKCNDCSIEWNHECNNTDVLLCLIIIYLCMHV